MPRPKCGSCRWGDKLTFTECCDELICTDCIKGHRKYSMCAYHYNEGHKGRNPQTCQQCLEDFDPKYEDCAIEPTKCATCSQRIKIYKEPHMVYGENCYCMQCGFPSNTPGLKASTNERNNINRGEDTPLETSHEQSEASYAESNQENSSNEEPIQETKKEKGAGSKSITKEKGEEKSEQASSSKQKTAPKRKAGADVDLQALGGTFLKMPEKMLKKNEEEIIKSKNKDSPKKIILPSSSTRRASEQAGTEKERSKDRSENSDKEKNKKIVKGTKKKMNTEDVEKEALSIGKD